jgi:hypothetical protein
MRKILIGLLICLFCFNHLLGETPNLPPEFQEKITNYQELIKTHQYTQAVSSIENTLKEAQTSSVEESVLAQLKTLLDDAQRQNKAFSNLIRSLNGSKKQEIYLVVSIGDLPKRQDAQTILIIDKANESGIEGGVKGNLKDKRKVSWTDIPVSNIYGLSDITKLKGEDKFNLAVWCFGHGLFAQAGTVLAAFYKEQPSKLALINPLLARIRNVPLPQGGFALYNETTWITAETAKQRAEVLKKLGTYKGVLDKPGADSEKLPWEKAREKETEHLIVKTNLSIDALNDICFVLESAYFTYQDLFGCEQPKGQKLRVMFAKNEAEFQKIRYDLTGINVSTGGCFIPALVPYNKSGQDHLLVFYNPLARKPLTANLMHECTHYAIRLVAQQYKQSDPPIWLNEGWATYYEASRLEGKRLVTNVINQWWLPVIKNAINQQAYIKLKDFINLSAQEHWDNEKVAYSEDWSLVYFLLNGQSGKYKPGLQAYMEAWKKGKIVVDSDGPKDKPTHLKLFEECMGVSIDQLEQEWKEYILQLK